MLRSLLLSILLSVFGQGFAANAQDGSPDLTTTATSNQVDELDIWLRAEQLNARCGFLNYFETRIIDGSIDEAVYQTDIKEQASLALGRGEYESQYAAINGLIEQRRLAARAIVADAPCNVGHPDIIRVRSTYMRQLYTMLAAIQKYPRAQTSEPVRFTAAQQLYRLISQLYGPQAEAMWQQVQADVIAKNINPEQAWNSLAKILRDGIWQLRMGEKGYAYLPVPGEQDTYRAIKVDQSGQFSGSFGILTSWLAEVAYQKAFPTLRAEGVSDHGRLIVMVMFEDPSKRPEQFQAQLLIQDHDDYSAWDKEDWRTGTTAHTASLLAPEDCPADFCFEFSDEVSQILRQNRKASSIGYRNELIIAAPELFPVSDTSIAQFRQPFRADILLED